MLVKNLDYYIGHYYTFKTNSKLEELDTKWIKFTFIYGENAVPDFDEILKTAKRDKVTLIIEEDLFIPRKVSVTMTKSYLKKLEERQEDFRRPDPRSI